MGGSPRDQTKNKRFQLRGSRLIRYLLGSAGFGMLRKTPEGGAPKGNRQGKSACLTKASFWGTFLKPEERRVDAKETARKLKVVGIDGKRAWTI